MRDGLQRRLETGRAGLERTREFDLTETIEPDLLDLAKAKLPPHVLDEVRVQSATLVSGFLLETLAAQNRRGTDSASLIDVYEAKLSLAAPEVGIGLTIAGVVGAALLGGTFDSILSLFLQKTETIPTRALVLHVLASTVGGSLAIWMLVERLRNRRRRHGPKRSQPPKVAKWHLPRRP